VGGSSRKIWIFLFDTKYLVFETGSYLMLISRYHHEGKAHITIFEEKRKTRGKTVKIFEKGILIANFHFHITISKDAPVFQCMPLKGSM
jgi:hypothetical protein